jgi:hypothetical protein
VTKLERALLAIVGAAACVALVPAAFAGPAVDPATLQPPAPPGSVCREDGPLTICHRETEDSWANVPIFDLPCGQLYETAVLRTDATRWYRDGLLVRRRVVQQSDAVWTLSPTGDAPTVSAITRNNWFVEYGVPGDLSSGSLTAHGTELTIRGVGTTLKFAGLDLPEGDHRGVLRFIDDPNAVASLCSALDPGAAG